MWSLRGKSNSILRAQERKAAEAEEEAWKLLNSLRDATENLKSAVEEINQIARRISDNYATISNYYPQKAKELENEYVKIINRLDNIQSVSGNDKVILSINKNEHKEKWFDK